MLGQDDAAVDTAEALSSVLVYSISAAVLRAMEDTVDALTPILDNLHYTASSAEEGRCQYFDGAGSECDCDCAGRGGFGLSLIHI